MSETDPHQQASDEQTKSEEALYAEHRRAETEKEARGQENRAREHRPGLELQSEESIRNAQVRTLFRENPHAALTKQEGEATTPLQPCPQKKEISSQRRSPNYDDVDSNAREQTIIDGLLSILALIHEEVRSYRVLLFSNLVLAFTIPIGAMATQDPKIFSIEKLWILPHPDWWLFSFWLLGVLAMAAGVAFVLPSMKTGSEAMAGHRTLEAARFLAEGKSAGAIASLLKAIEQENNRLETTNWTRIPFFVAFFLFLACVTIEFAMMLFS